MPRQEAIWRYDPQATISLPGIPVVISSIAALRCGKAECMSRPSMADSHALDAATGVEVWEADTVIDHKMPYSSTGAPQIAGRVVVIGNSGADMGKGGVRGYVSPTTSTPGRSKWRVFTVPPGARTCL